MLLVGKGKRKIVPVL